MSRWQMEVGVRRVAGALALVVLAGCEVVTAVDLDKLPQGSGGAGGSSGSGGASGGGAPTGAGGSTGGTDGGADADGG